MKRFRTAKEVENHVAELFAPCEGGTQTVVRCLTHAAAAHLMGDRGVFDPEAVLRAANAATKLIDDIAIAAARGEVTA